MRFNKINFFTVSLRTFSRKSSLFLFYLFFFNTVCQRGLHWLHMLLNATGETVVPFSHCVTHTRGSCVRGTVTGENQTRWLNVKGNTNAFSGKWKSSCTDKTACFYAELEEVEESGGGAPLTCAMDSKDTKLRGCFIQISLCVFGDKGLFLWV